MQSGCALPVRTPVALNLATRNKTLIPSWKKSIASHMEEESVIQVAGNPVPPRRVTYSRR